MDISVELLIMIVINVLLGGIYIGGLAMAIKFIEKQIERLEQKQDKYNNLISRMFSCEKSLEAGHARLDNFSEQLEKLRDTLEEQIEKLRDTFEEQIDKLHDKVYGGK